jgi:hypothetical protein
MRTSRRIQSNLRGENEQARAWNVDYTTSLRDLFALVATNSHSFIMLPPTNATHFDLKPHVIQLLPSFHGLDLENPYSHMIQGYQCYI